MIFSGKALSPRVKKFLTLCKVFHKKPRSEIQLNFLGLFSLFYKIFPINLYRDFILGIFIPILGFSSTLISIKEKSVKSSIRNFYFY